MSEIPQPKHDFTPDSVPGPANIDPTLGKGAAANPYERFSDDQLDALKTSLLDSVASSITDPEDLARSSQNLIGVVKESERRLPDDQKPPVPEAGPNTFYVTTLDDASINKIADNIINTQSADLVTVHKAYYDARRESDMHLAQGDKVQMKQAAERSHLLRGVQMQLMRLKAPGWDDYRTDDLRRIVELEKPNSPRVSPEPSLPVVERQVSAEQLKFRAITFEEASRLPKGFSEDFVVGLLSDDLRTPDGLPSSLKGYLDEVPATKEDQELATRPKSLAQIHRETRQMIADNLKIAVGPDVGPKERAFLSGQKDKYLAGLLDGAQKGDAFFDDLASGSKPKGLDILFGGLNVPQTINGEVRSKNILDVETGVRGVRPNVRIQDGLGSQFIHWSTDKYAGAKARGEADDKAMTKRIYLNPRPEDSVKVFSAIMLAANEAGMSVHGKMLDRAMEFAGKTTRAKAGEVLTARADGIVLYADDAQANELLGLVEALSKDAPDIFIGRPTSKIPIKIADGIAVGSEPVAEKGTESLTTHRAAVLIEVGDRTMQRLGLKRGDKVPPSMQDTAYKTFQEEFKTIAPQRGVNPDNFAFNLG